MQNENILQFPGQTFQQQEQDAVSEYSVPDGNQEYITEEDLAEPAALTEESGEESVPFPSALLSLQMRGYLIGALVFIFSVGFAIIWRDYKVLLVGLFSFWFIYNAYIIKKRFYRGEIEELPLICVSANAVTMRNVAVVNFRTAEEPPAYYSYTLTGKRHADNYIPGNVYLVYYYKDTPSQLLASEPLGK